MVQLISGPQNTIPVREDSTMNAIAGITKFLMNKMQQNQAVRSKGDVENTKQVQDLMSAFIQKGATPKEAQAVAMKMVGNYKPLDKSNPWLMQNEQGQDTLMPNIQNIWGDIGARLQTPIWQGPAQVQSKEPFAYQKKEMEKTQSEINKNNRRTTGSGSTDPDVKLKIAALQFIAKRKGVEIEDLTDEDLQSANDTYITLKTMGPNAIIPKKEEPPVKDNRNLLQKWLGFPDPTQAAPTKTATAVPGQQKTPQRQPKEGDIVVNKKTGEKRVLKGGKWLSTK